MFYFSLVLTFVVVFVVGEMLGLLAQCEKSKHLRLAKAYVWCVPLMQLYLLVKLVVDAFKNRNFGMVVAFFRFGESGVIALSCISGQIERSVAKKKVPVKMTWPHFCQAADSLMYALETAT